MIISTVKSAYNQNYGYQYCTTENHCYHFYHHCARWVNALCVCAVCVLLSASEVKYAHPNHYLEIVSTTSFHQ